MSQGKAAVFETDGLLFPVKSEREMPEKKEEIEIVEVKKRLLESTSIKDLPVFAKV